MQPGLGVLARTTSGGAPRRDSLAADERLDRLVHPPLEPLRVASEILFGDCLEHSCFVLATGAVAIGSNDAIVAEANLLRGHRSAECAAVGMGKPRDVPVKIRPARIAAGIPVWEATGAAAGTVGLALQRRDLRRRRSCAARPRLRRKGRVTWPRLLQQ